MATGPLGERMTLPAAARYLGVTARSLEGMVRRRQIAFHRLTEGGRHYFYRPDLDAFIAATRVEPETARVSPPSSYRSVAHLMPATRELS